MKCLYRSFLFHTKKNNKRCCLLKLSHPELIMAISKEYDIDVETIRKVLNAIKDYMVNFLMDVEENEVNEIFLTI